MSVISWSVDDDTSGTTAYINAKFLTATYSGPVIRRMARHNFVGSPWRSPERIVSDKMVLPAATTNGTKMVSAWTGGSFQRLTGVVPVGGGPFALTYDRYTIRTLAPIPDCRSTHDFFPALLACDSIPAECQSCFHASVQPRALSFSSQFSDFSLVGSLPTASPPDWRIIRIQQPNKKYSHDATNFANGLITPCGARQIRAMEWLAQSDGFEIPIAFDAADNAVLIRPGSIQFSDSSGPRRVPIIAGSIEITVGITGQSATPPTIRITATSDQRGVALATLDITPSVVGGYVGYCETHTLTISPAQRDMTLSLSGGVVSGSLGFSPVIQITTKQIPILPGFARQMQKANGFSILPGAAKKVRTLRTV